MTNGWDLLGAFSDPTRQAVLDLLRQRPSTVGELAAQLPVSRPAVSQHLRVLKSVGLVDEQRRGTRHFFRLNPKTLAELRSHVDSMWRDALEGFSSFANKELAQNGKGIKKTRPDSKKRACRLPH
jgi:DNA-binding transcriptional ArsR family regulator